jgi:hypothetical protein
MRLIIAVLVIDMIPAMMGVWQPGLFLVAEHLGKYQI